jgi:hypothetical protein
MATAAQTVCAALVDLEQREGQLEERMRTVDAHCQQKLGPRKYLQRRS